MAGSAITSYIQQARGEMGEEVEGLLRASSQFLTIVSGQAGVALSQAGR